jgi:hypothetical protein
MGTKYDLNGELCRSALKHFQVGLDELDQSGAPGDIGAHIDLAICRLEEVLTTLTAAPMLTMKIANEG